MVVVGSWRPGDASRWSLVGGAEGLWECRSSSGPRSRRGKQNMYIKSDLAFRRGKAEAEAAGDEAKHQSHRVVNGKRRPQPDRPRCRVSSRVICWRLEIPYSYLATVALASCNGGSLEARLTRRSSDYPLLQVRARGQVINHALACRQEERRAREQCQRSCLRFQLQRRRVECVDGE